MSNKFPHHYSITVHAGDHGASVTAPPRPPLPTGAPPQFGGSDEVWSPEHLLLAAVASCFWTTFHALAARMGLDAGESMCRAIGTVDKTSSGLAFTEIHLLVGVEVAEGQVELGRELVTQAEEHCLVANSLKTPVAVEALITVALAPTAPQASP